MLATEIDTLTNSIDTQKDKKNGCQRWPYLQVSMILEPQAWNSTARFYFAKKKIYGNLHSSI